VPTAVALRPRSFSELFDAAFLLVREHFRPLATLSAIVAIPAILLNAANVALFGPLTTPGTPADPLAMLHTLPLTLVSTCWYFVGVAAMLDTASRGYLGEPIDPAASLRRAVRRAGALVAAHLLAYLAAAVVLAVAMGAVAVAGVAVAAGLRVAGLRPPGSTVVAVGFTTAGASAALAAAGLVLARYVNMSAVLMLEEGGGAVDALRRSSALSAGHRWRIVGLFAILAAVSLAFSFTALGIGSLAGNAYVSGVVATLFAVPLYPLVAGVLAALYYDLRIRKEGFDIARAARELGPAAPVSAPAA
jgi:hypothetical protein